MRRSLAWTLAASAALAALTLWVPRRAMTIVHAVESRRSSNEQPPLGDGVIAQPASSLPQALDPLVIDSARRDPFADGPSPSGPAAKAAAAPVPPSLTPQPQLPNPPPPMTWRLLGTMDSPDGERKIILAPANDAQAVVASPGLQLAGGYEVAHIGPDSVQLVHPPTRTEVVIPILPPPLDGR